MNYYPKYCVYLLIPSIILTIITIVLVTMMPVWRFIATPMVALEIFPMSATEFLSRIRSMTTISNQEVRVIPVIHPLPGNIYMLAQKFYFTPLLRLDSGYTYRLYITAVDVIHGFQFPLAHTDLLLIPGYVVVIPLKPLVKGHYTIQCSEYCGLEHSRMRGEVLIQEDKQ